jgi:hypothetical protein
LGRRGSNEVAIASGRARAVHRRSSSRVFRRRKEAQALAQSSNEVVEFANSLVDGEGAMSEADVDKVLAFARERGYGTEPSDERPVPVPALRIMQVGMANRGRFVTVDSTLLLKADEVAYAEVPARLLKEVVDRQFEDSLIVEVLDYIDADPWVICVSRWEARTKDGMAVGVRSVDAYEVEDGKIKRSGGGYRDLQAAQTALLAE